MVVCDYSGEFLYQGMVDSYWLFLITLVSSYTRGWWMLMVVCDYSGEFLYQGMVDAYGCL